MINLSSNVISLMNRIINFLLPTNGKKIKLETNELYNQKLVLSTSDG